MSKRNASFVTTHTAYSWLVDRQPAPCFRALFAARFKLCKCGVNISIRNANRTREWKEQTAHSVDGCLSCKSFPPGSRPGAPTNRMMEPIERTYAYNDYAGACISIMGASSEREAAWNRCEVRCKSIVKSLLAYSLPEVC